MGADAPYPITMSAAAPAGLSRRLQFPVFPKTDPAPPYPGEALKHGALVNIQKKCDFHRPDVNSRSCLFQQGICGGLLIRIVSPSLPVHTCIVGLPPARHLRCRNKPVKFARWFHGEGIIPDLCECSFGHRDSGILITGDNPADEC